MVTTAQKRAAKKTAPPKDETPDTPPTPEPVTATSLFDGLTLEDAEPVPGSGGLGKIAEPNPWHDVVSDLLKADAITKRTTKGFTVPYETEDDKKAADKLVRQLQAAGTPPKGDEREPVTVRVKTSAGKPEGSERTMLAVRFWLIAKIKRKSKAEKEAEEAAKKDGEKSTETPDGEAASTPPAA